MGYVALYRKARPKTFDEVKGQDHIVTTLKNQIRMGRIQHAYLFCGTRGTGKTSIAKIMARAINCTHAEDGNPCNECDSCKEILEGNSLNVIEMDAASNNGVDNIRDIVDAVRYRPTNGKYKVFIIDEVHMLSTGAFNALLKTLEEPPEWAVFILATTESGKIPQTILSRCQRYDFHRIGIDTIVEQMSALAKKEGAECEERALRFVARQADGSMRDALSLLDQCLAFHVGETLTYERALDTLGAADTDVYGELLGDVLAGDAGKCVLLFQQMMERGREAGQFVADFIWYLRNTLLVASAKDASQLVDVSREQMDMMMAYAKRAKAQPEILMRYIRIMSELQSSMRFSNNRRVLTEIALVKLCRPQMERTDDAVLDRIRMIENHIGLSNASGTISLPVQAVNAAETTKGTSVTAEPVPDMNTTDDWTAVQARLPYGMARTAASVAPEKQGENLSFLTPVMAWHLKPGTAYGNAVLAEVRKAMTFVGNNSNLTVYKTDVKLPPADSIFNKERLS